MKDSMMLVTSNWGQQKTFKMIPVTLECPYNEGIYDPQAKVLALISKEQKQTMHMMAKLNEWGDVVPMKIGKRSNGKDYAEERKTLDTYYEYFVEDAAEIKQIIERFALNADDFDYDKYLTVAEAPVQSNILTGL
jgi:hypothetical protein